MSGGIAVGNARVRIKGRKGSVVRFLIISIAYTLPWIIMLSQLAYYSKVYGPQVLLQLNIAYYLPSIPVLLLFGQIEKLLDAEFGRTGSMALRLMAGLASCAAIAAYYPFMPTRLAYLLGLVVVLGAVSSVAFSTSYQLVAWFRSADTIALGIGCVASGPLALVIQVALQIGTNPKHWQWIALFEVAAGVVVIGMAAAVSLLWQYWGILSGTEEYDDGSRQPLLESEAQERHVEEEAGQQALMLSRMITLQDPFQGFPFTTTPGMIMPYPHSSTLRRAASDDITDRRRHARSDRAAVAAEAGAAGLKPSPAAAAAAAAAAGASRGLKHSATQGPRPLCRASAPLHATEHASLFDGSLQPQAAAAGSSLHASTAASGGAAAGNGGSSSGPVPSAAYVAANARAATLQHYSGLPMVPPPHVGTGSTAAGSTGSIKAAWLPDIEQQLLMLGGGSNAGSVGTGSTPIDTPKAAWLAASLASLSPKSSRAASPGPLGSSRPMPTPAAAAAAGGGGVPAPAFTAGSYVGELPDLPQHQQQQHQQQQHLLSSVLGASAPVLPASLLAESSDDGTSLHNRDDAVINLLGHDVSDDGGPEVSHLDTRDPPGQLQHHTASQQQQQHQQQQSVGANQEHRIAQQHHQQHHQQQHQQQAEQVVHVLPPAAAGAAGKAAAGHKRTGSTGSVGAASSAAATAGGGAESEEGKEEPESLAAVFVEVLQGTWMVVLAALISSTLLNCIFPFFTYVESSGLLGEFLPQVLFYTRMLSDIMGRMLPRKKMLAITAPAALLALSGGLLIASAAFFVYLQVPPRLQHDPYVLVLILLLWLGGGYINTMSYILAPSLVAPRVCTKASALMALTYQVAHILGLVVATGLALALYGDIAGEL